MLEHGKNDFSMFLAFIQYKKQIDKEDNNSKFCFFTM